MLISQAVNIQISFFFFMTATFTCEDIGYISLDSTDTCIKLSMANSQLSWVDANTTCHSDGGNLLRITTSKMLHEVLNITSGIGKLYNFEIGLHIVSYNETKCFTCIISIGLRKISKMLLKLCK